MADKLPWFPFYPQDWMTDPDVLELTGDQMAAFLWLLCLQWREGQLPYEAHRAVPMVPRAIDDKAVVYVLLRFFPPDPDTNERRNPRLERIRVEQEEKQEANRSRTAKARAARHPSVTTSVTETESEPETETDKLMLGGGNPMDFPTQMRVAFNAAMKGKSEADTYLRPIRGAEQAAVDWKDYPEEFVLGVIRDVCGKFQPSPENPRISTFKYFDAAIRKAWKQSQEVSATQLADQRMAEVIAQMQQDYEKGVL